MSTEALVLALSAVVRPTSAAAVFGMLSTRRPQRLLASYVGAGLAFSLAVGVLVVVLAQQLSPAEAKAGRPFVDITLGVVAVAYAGAVWWGVWPRPRAEGAPPEERAGSRAWMRRLQDLSPRGAATAGVLTHLPGLVYLAGLNAIIGTSAGTLGSVAQVVVYNAIWFSLAIAALALSAYRPELSRRKFEEGASWARRNRRVIVVVFCGVLGAYLIAGGVVDLVGQPERGSP
ncbi:MAG: GAP family protein [Pseudonocardia sediminis]